MSKECIEIYKFLKGLRTGCGLTDIVENNWENCFERIKENCSADELVYVFKSAISCARCDVYECIINRKCNIKCFLNSLIWLDFIRHNYSAEWYLPHVVSNAQKYIFNNQNPNQGLLIFTLLNFINAGVNPKTVGSKLLRDLYMWVNGRGPQPRTRYRTANIWTANIHTSLSHMPIGYWFADTVIRIVKKHGKSKGNMYRFAGSLCTSLLGYGSGNHMVRALLNGLPPTSHIKRLWMYLMFIRRDNYLIKDLVVRALKSSSHPNWKDALCYWYDNNYFDEKEIELPVDNRVMDAWNNIIGRLCPQYKGKTPQKIAQVARGVARKYGVPPSVFDVLFWIYEN